MDTKTATLDFCQTEFIRKPVLGSLPKFTRRRFLLTTGVASAAVVLTLQPRQLRASTTGTYGSGVVPQEEEPGSGSSGGSPGAEILAVYAEPPSLDSPYTLSIQKVHMRVQNPEENSIEGKWKFAVSINLPAGGTQLVGSAEKPGTFPGSSVPKVHVPVTGLLDLWEFSKEWIMDLDGAIPWQIDVQFVNTNNTLVAAGTGLPEYGIKLTTGAVRHGGHAPPATGNTGGDDKYDNAHLWVGTRHYEDTGLPKVAVLNEWYDDMVLGIASAGMRTTVNNFAGPESPVSPMIARAVPEWEVNERRYWNVTGAIIGISGLGLSMGAGFVPENTRLLSNNELNAWIGQRGPFSNRSYDRKEYAGFKTSDGVFEDNVTQDARGPADRPSIAASIYGEWFGESAVLISAVIHSAWVQPSSGLPLLYVNAIADPKLHFEIDGGTRQATEKPEDQICQANGSIDSVTIKVDNLLLNWSGLFVSGPNIATGTQIVTVNIPPPNSGAPKTLTLSIPSTADVTGTLRISPDEPHPGNSNKVPRDETKKVMGPGVSANWQNLPLDKQEFGAAGFFWNVSEDGSTMTDHILTDHNEGREFKLSFILNIHGPVDKKKVQ